MNVNTRLNIQLLSHIVLCMLITYKHYYVCRHFEYTSPFLVYIFPKVSIVFQKVAAEILGIKLTRPDMEQHQRVVKAEINTYRAQEAAAKPVVPEKRSAFCSIQ